MPKNKYIYLMQTSPSHFLYIKKPTAGPASKTVFNQSTYSTVNGQWTLVGVQDRTSRTDGRLAAETYWQMMEYFQQILLKPLSIIRMTFLA